MFAINCPKKKNGNQIKWTSTVNMGVCIIEGPGHNPPIPHPNPKHKAPPTNLVSITVLFGLKSFYPKNGYFLTLII